MRPDAPYFIILLCLTPHDFTHQGESVATQLVACMSGSMLEIEPATEVNKKWIYPYESYAKFPLVRNK
jgi:hypothetical protein